jgi:hypothetical protein
LSRNWISFFSYSDLDLDYIQLCSNPKLPLYISYPYTKFGVNRPKQTQVIEQKLNFYFSNSDLELDHSQLGRCQVWCQYAKANLSYRAETKSWRLAAHQPACPHADFGITITRFALKTWLKSGHGHINLSSVVVRVQIMKSSCLESHLFFSFKSAIVQ